MWLADTSKCSVTGYCWAVRDPLLQDRDVSVHCGASEDNLSNIFFAFDQSLRSARLLRESNSECCVG